jgi:predicted ribonuclease toxin of YeeF-YezG toxin-antitoxin module
MKVKVPGPRFPDKRTAALTRRLDMKAREEDIRNELESLAADYTDAQVQLAELGADLADLDRQDEAESAAIAEAAAGGGVTGGLGPASPEDFLDAAAAEAALTPDVGDDIAVAEQAVAHFGRGLDAARAGGDPRAIAAAAQALLAARNNLDQLKATRDNTDALNANTAAVQGFGGSSTFSYRGQDYTLRSLAPPSSDRLVEATI